MKKSRKKKTPKRVLALPDLEQAKSTVLNSLTSTSAKRTYEHAINEFVRWYCSEPRLAFNRAVVLRFRIHLEHRGYAPATINLRLAAVRRVAYEAADSGLLSPELAAGIRRVSGSPSILRANLPPRNTGQTQRRPPCLNPSGRPCDTRFDGWRLTYRDVSRFSGTDAYRIVH